MANPYKPLSQAWWEYVAQQTVNTVDPSGNSGPPALPNPNTINTGILPPAIPSIPQTIYPTPAQTTTQSTQNQSWTQQILTGIQQDINAVANTVEADVKQAGTWIASNLALVFVLSVGVWIAFRQEITEGAETAAKVAAA